MRYTIAKYLRLSAEDIDLDGLEKYESNSIINQRDLLDDFISKMPESADCDIIEALDDGWTGTNFQRPGVQRILDLAQHSKVNCIVVKDLSRFGRSHIEVGDYLEQKFPLWGVRFISVNDMYDSANYSGVTGGINMAFRSLIAEMYSQDLSEKVRSAKDTLSKSGKSLAPYGFYGYITDPADRHKLIIDEPAADVVRLIFNLYEQGLSAIEIARKFNDDGVQTANERKREQGAKRNWMRNGKVGVWDSGFIQRILKDERYTGKHIYGKARRVGLGKQIYKAMPKSEWIIVPNAIPAIISAEQYERARIIASSRSHEKPDKAVSKPQSLFPRKILCGVCGKSLVRIRRNNGFGYRCSTPSIKSGLNCMHGSIPESVIIETVLTVIKQQAKIAEGLKSFQVTSEKSSAVKADGLRDSIQLARRLIDKANSAKLALWEKQHTGSISRETFLSESDRLTAHASECSQRISELESEIRILERTTRQENTFVERFSKQAGIQELTKEVVTEFIKAIHVYTADRIEVILNYADEYEKAAALLGNVSSTTNASREVYPS